MTTLWSGRFDGAPDPDAFEFGASFRFDRRLFDEDVTGSLAWARALGRAGVLPKSDVEQIEKALDRAQLAETVGTIAGDDTILVVARDGKRAAALVKRLESYAEN